MGQSVLGGLGKEPFIKPLKSTEINQADDLFMWLIIVMVTTPSSWPVCSNFEMVFKIP